MQCIKVLWQRFTSWLRSLFSGAAQKAMQKVAGSPSNQAHLLGTSSAKPCVPQSKPMNEAQHLVFWLTGQYGPFRLVQR